MASSVEKPDYKSLTFDSINRQIAAIMSADGESLSDLCRKRGVTPPSEFKQAPGSMLVEIDDLVRDAGCHARSVIACAEAQGLPPGEVSNFEQHIEQYLEGLTEEEAGRPGTPWSGYLPRTEHTGRLAPYRARGIANSPGIFEKHGKEPICYKNLQSIKEFLANVDRWSLPVPDDCPDDIREEVQAACDVVWGGLQSIEGGLEAYFEDASSAWQFGFSWFEVVWGAYRGKAMPRKLAFREASSVQDWLLDADERELAAIRARPGGRSGSTYVLPARGPRLQDCRVILNTVGGRGLNFEGVPPTRVCDVLIAKKKLLLTMEAVCAERFGGPILTQIFDPSALQDGTSLDGDDWADVFALVSHMEAKDTLAIALAAGIRLEYVNPVGTPPQFQQQLEYIDKQIALVWSNQGALLGMTGHGSHALASVQESDLLRSAPYYARVVTRHLNELIRKILMREFNLDLVTYPRLRWNVHEEQDVGEWLNRLKTFYELQPNMPLSVQQQVATKLGIALDDAPEEQPAMISVAQRLTGESE